MRKALIAVSLAAAMTTASCGTTTSDRALSGAGLGALGGAAIGSVTGSAGKGAVIVGAAAGALIPADQANLGDPIWRRNHSCVDGRLLPVLSPELSAGAPRPGA